MIAVDQNHSGQTIDLPVGQVGHERGGGGILAGAGLLAVAADAEGIIGVVGEGVGGGEVKTPLKLMDSKALSS